MLRFGGCSFGRNLLHEVVNVGLRAGKFYQKFLNDQTIPLLSPDR